ncbi:hypothetical protein GMSM_27440 [Geomonas sp. Red276]
MEKTGQNYKALSIGELKALGRVTLNKDLELTGSEISFNELPPGVSIPFIHAHKRNEEVYLILEGKGLFHLDGDEFAIEAGTVVRVDPAARRCIKADEGSSLRFVCIQTEAKSLVQHTETDGVILEDKPSWLK